MPPRKGNVQHNIHLTEEISRQLAALAESADYGGKTEVVQTALDQLIQNTFEEAPWTTCIIACRWSAVR